MTARVFLHIGAPQSGVAELRQSFGLNRGALAVQGVHYPGTRGGDHFEAAIDVVADPAAGNIEAARGQWASLVHEAHRASGDVLISHEVLAAASTTSIARAMADFPAEQVHVILTARDLGRQIPAEWQDRVTHRRGRQSFKVFMAQVVAAPRSNPTSWFWRMHGVPDVLTRWSNRLPPRQVHVVTVPPAGAPDDLLWRRFCSVIGADPARQYVRPGPSGGSGRPLGIAEVGLVRRLNRLLRGRDVSHEAYDELVREVILAQTFGNRPDLDPVVVPQGRWRFLERVNEEWLEWIRGSGVQVHGDLADLVPVPPGEGHRWRHPDRPRPQVVGNLALEALAAVIADASETHEWNVRRLARRLLRG